MFRKRIQCLVLLLSFFSFLEVYAQALAFEAPRYTIEATLDYPQKTITATETVSFTNNTATPVNELYFHIYANRKYSAEEKEFMLRYAGYFKVNPFPDGFQRGKVEIRSVTTAQKQLSFVVEGEDETLLKIPLPDALNANETIEVALQFTLTVPHAYGRFGWHENIMSLSRWYPILSVLNEDGWNNHPFYPFHRPFFSDAAYYTIQLIVPENQTVIHTGTLENEGKNSDGTKSLRIKTDNPVRDFSLALSADYKIFEQAADEITVKSFYLNGNEAHAKEAAQDALDVMKFYTQRFGPYPYKEFSIAPVYLGYGGEQTSNMIFIDTRVFELPQFLGRYFDFLISHETGHQWIYNVIGVDGFKEMWLEEGVNSYFNLQYLEGKYGKDATIVELPKSLEWLLPNASFRRGRDYRYKLIARTNLNQPVTGKLSSFTEPSSIFSITYGKGSAIVSMLRYLMGDEAFGRAFARIFKEYRFQNIDTKIFKSICEAESKKDLTDFFKQWLHTKEIFDVAVSRVEGRTVSIENHGEIAMPVAVEAEFTDGTKQDFVWEGKSPTGQIEIPGATPIKRITLDPQHELLDIDRTNNIWPRKLFIKPVPLYLGLYDIPIFLPEDSYNLVFGPEFANGGPGIKASWQKPYDQHFYAASDYDFNDSLMKSRLGYQLNYIDHLFRSAGFELFNTTDLDGGEEDLAGAKAYIRQELWPASYGATDINDHVTLYLIRNRSLNQGFSVSNFEDSRNTSYLKKDEAIVGGVLHLGRAGAYPDPSKGYKLDALLENSGHMLGATQYFYRGSMDFVTYAPVTAKTKIAWRLKYGWGYPLDKNLYEIGGWEGLRGYDRKTLRGARAALTSLEYRFPIKENINMRFFDNIFGVESLGGVVFFDAGQSWNNNFDDSDLKKDAGLGLRMAVTVGSFLEKVLVRFDVAEPVNDSKEDTHYWFGVGHAF